MKHKNKNRFQKKTLKMKDHHTWKAPPGHKIVVLERGAVSFNIPHSWELTQTDPVELYDQEPPNDNARLSITFWRFPPGIDWTGLPLIPLLTQATQGVEDEEHKILERTEIVPHTRTDLEIVWTEHRFLDSTENREAFSRIAVARGWGVHILITLDYWVDEAKKFRPVWDEVMRSLQLGRYIEDPTTGVTLH